MTTAYEEHLTTYFESRRWFAGKGRSFTISHIHPLPWLADDDEFKVRIEVVTVVFEDGTSDTYQFPVAYLDEPDPDLVHALVGEIDHPELGSVAAYDAVFLRPASDLLLSAFIAEQKRDALTFCVVDGADIPAAGTPGTVMTAEQSNTSIAFGEDAMLKLFRRISAGGNPDIEIHEALTRHGSEHIAALFGWIEGEWLDAKEERHFGHLGMLQAFLRTATDGWDLALTSVRDLMVEEDLHPDEVGGDFASESHRLGVATAEVHADLADIFETAVLGGEELTALAQAMQRRLDHATTVVPELMPHVDGLRRRFVAVTDVDEPVAAQRIHGDFHLGQTLRTVKGWKIIDFEGEPAKTVAERVALDSPLRDVAGMLRSFDYASGSTLLQFGENPQLHYRADEWADRNRQAFIDGYCTASDTDPTQHQQLLSAYEADKAIYEAVYESRNRPGWLPIPMHAIERIASEE